MFKRLRQKIETVDGASSPNKDAGMRSFSHREDGSQAHLSGMAVHKSDSMNSLCGSDAEIPTESTTREELHAMLLSRTTQLKRLEVKLAEYGQSLKERTRECEKLTGALEKQQDSALRKLNDLNETYGKERLRYESTIDRLEKNERELFSETEKLQEENEKLKSCVEEWETEKVNFEKQKNEFYEKRDNSEELHDLQMQEIAKLKHMLMNSEKESKSLQLNLDAHVAELMQARERNDDLEASLRKYGNERDTAEAQLTQLLKDKEKLLESKQCNEAAIKKFTIDNGDLRDKLSSLALDLQKTRSGYSTLEATHSVVSEKYEMLKHTCESIASKAKTDSEEKQSLIDHFQEKLKLLEQRSHAEKLPQDEQIQAFIAERTSLETKLEEARQQLVNIKSTWSDRINQLETQVAHLNSKIAEDSEEISRKSAELESLKTESKDKIDDLVKEVENLKETSEDLATHNNSYLQQVAELEANLIEQQTVYELEKNKLAKHVASLEDDLLNQRKNHLAEKKALDKKLQEANDAVSALENDVDALKKNHQDEQTTLRHEIELLGQSISEKNLEITDRERISSEMAISLEEVRSDRDELKSKKQEVENELKNTSSALRLAQEEAEDLKTKLAATQAKFADVEAKLSASSQELEASRGELREKHKGLVEFQDSSEEKERQMQSLSAQVENLAATLEGRTRELMSCKEEIAALKNNQADESEEVKSLKIERSRLEDRLLEKDRSLKLSQQRLVDVKKALQKELNKQQSGSSRSHSTEGAGRDRQRSSSRQRSMLQPASTNGHEEAHLQNGTALEPDVDPIQPFLSGDISLDDPSLNEGQRDVVIKYLKHVILRFLSCGQSESQQLVKAMSMILRFTPDEEKLVREILDYRSSWFASKPSTKNVIKPSVRGKGYGRHKR